MYKKGLMNKLKLVITSKKDLSNVMSLWNDGETMKYVGFPNGLNITLEKLEKWEIWVTSKGVKRRHFSIYRDDLGYCGETYYDINDSGYVIFDIKLLSHARGKGIAFEALSFSIKEAKLNGGIIGMVDPQETNFKAISLYHKLGFKPLDKTNYYLIKLNNANNTLFNYNNIGLEEILIDRVDDYFLLHEKYLINDLLPFDTSNDANFAEDLAYFKSDEYRLHLKKAMLWPESHIRMFYFTKGNQKIGCCAYIIYHDEAGKCLLMDFWLFEEFRNKGIGKITFKTLEKFIKQCRGSYFSINCTVLRAKKFWESLGFVEDGVDEHNTPTLRKEIL